MPCVAGIHVWLQRIIACRGARHSLSFMLCCLYRMAAFRHQQGLPAGVGVTFSLHPWYVGVCVCRFWVWCVSVCVWNREKDTGECVCTRLCTCVSVCVHVYICVCVCPVSYTPDTGIHLQVVYARDWTGRCQQKRKLHLHSSRHYTCIWCIFSVCQFAELLVFSVSFLHASLLNLRVIILLSNFTCW